MGARAVGENRGFALLQNRQGEIRGENGFAVAAGQRAEGIIGISDPAKAVPANDHVVLRFKEARGAFLRFPDFPIAVRGLVEACLERP